LKAERPDSSALLRTCRGHKGRIRASAFGSGGLQVASAGDDGVIMLWSFQASVKSSYQLGTVWYQSRKKVSRASLPTWAGMPTEPRPLRVMC
jgi:WD40 repeat protein